MYTVVDNLLMLHVPHAWMQGCSLFAIKWLLVNLLTVQPSKYGYQRDMLKCLYYPGDCIMQGVSVNVMHSCFIDTKTKTYNLKQLEQYMYVPS